MGGKDSSQSCVLVWHIFKYSGLADEFKIERCRLSKLVDYLYAHYSQKIGYHNWGHAFSTFHLMYVLMESVVLESVLPRLDVMSLLLAALGHDVEHEGFNNTFLINKRAELAIRYNDLSVLENHHASVTV